MKNLIFLTSKDYSQTILKQEYIIEQGKDGKAKEVVISKTRNLDAIKDGATVYVYTNSDGLTTYRTANANIDANFKDKSKEIRKKENELFRAYQKHEITVEQYTSALTELHKN